MKLKHILALFVLTFASEGHCQVSNEKGVDFMSYLISEEGQNEIGNWSNDSLFTLVDDFEEYLQLDSRLGLCDSFYGAINYELKKRDLFEQAYEINKTYIEQPKVQETEFIYLNAVLEIIEYSGKDEEELSEYIDIIENAIERGAPDNIEMNYNFFKGHKALEENDFEASIRSYLKADSLAIIVEDKFMQGQIPFSLGRVYYYQLDYPNALKYFKQSAEAFKDEKYEYISAMQAAGIVYMYLDSLEEAEQIMLELNPQLDFSPSEKSQNLSTLQEIQYRLGKYEASIATFEKIQVLMDESSTAGNNQANNLEIAALSYWELDQPRKARFYKNEYRKLYSENEAVVNLLEINDILYQKGANEARGLLSNYINLKDEQVEELINNNSKELNEKYQTERKQLENENLRLEQEKLNVDLKNKNAQLYIGIGILTFILFLFYQLYQLYKKKSKLNQSLEAKSDQIQLLNQELNHRVKNNLAFVTTLMQMQGRRAEQSETKELLKDSENRLLALSKVHGRLKYGDKSDVELKHYVEDIVSNLKGAFDSSDKRISIEQQIDDITIDGDVAVRLGLIINELITNSVKHIDESAIEIDLTIEKTASNIVLQYKDNGSGIVQHLEQANSGKSMGLQMINILKDQLQGKVDVVLV